VKKGAICPCEGAWHTDVATGARIRQITSNAAISHPTYFLQNSFFPGDRRLFFVSYRTGAAQLYCADYPEGDIVQMTDAAPIHPFSPALHPNGEEIVFTRGGALWTIRIRDLCERQIIDTGAILGEPSIDPHGEWITAAYDLGGSKGLVVASMYHPDWDSIPFGRTVIHPQFHPLDSDWIEFAGDPAPRMHRVRRDGRGLECLYQHGNEEFVVHETFLGRTGDIVFTVWPKRLCRMTWDTREVSTIAEYNAWHIAPDRDGTRVLCDTNHPDEGLQVIDVESGSREQVCLSEATNQGTQWKTSRYALADEFAASRTSAEQAGSWMEAAVDTVYGPQWTHPHPSWSNDETKIAFASDRTGTTQVYVVEYNHKQPE
jgi:hypothetical protein